MNRWPTCKSSRYKRVGFLAYLIHPLSLNHLSNGATWDLPEERTLSWQISVPRHNAIRVIVCHRVNSECLPESFSS